MSKQDDDILNLIRGSGLPEDHLPQMYMSKAVAVRLGFCDYRIFVDKYPSYPKSKKARIREKYWKKVERLEVNAYEEWRASESN